MAWIAEVTDAEATGDVADLYAQLRERVGVVPNILRAMSLWPELLSIYRAWYRTLMGTHSALSVAQKETIALAVSEANQSLRYCVRHHETFASRNGVDTGAVRSLARGEAAVVSVEVRALVDYAIMVTHRWNEIVASDLEALRTSGFTDRQILEATVIAAHFQFDNRIVQALGVELE